MPITGPRKSCAAVVVLMCVLGSIAVSEDVSAPPAKTGVIAQPITEDGSSAGQEESGVVEEEVQDSTTLPPDDNQPAEEDVDDSVSFEKRDAEKGNFRLESKIRDQIRKRRDLESARKTDWKIRQRRFIGQEGSLRSGNIEHGAHLSEVSPMQSNSEGDAEDVRVRRSRMNDIGHNEIKKMNTDLSHLKRGTLHFPARFPRDISEENEQIVLKDAIIPSATLGVRRVKRAPRRKLGRASNNRRKRPKTVNRQQKNKNNKNSPPVLTIVITPIDSSNKNSRRPSAQRDPRRFNRKRNRNSKQSSRRPRGGTSYSEQADRLEQSNDGQRNRISKIRARARRPRDLGVEEIDAAVTEPSQKCKRNTSPNGEECVPKTTTRRQPNNEPVRRPKENESPNKTVLRPEGRARRPRDLGVEDTEPAATEPWQKCKRNASPKGNECVPRTTNRRQSKNEPVRLPKQNKSPNKTVQRPEGRARRPRNLGVEEIVPVATEPSLKCKRNAGPNDEVCGPRTGLQPKNKSVRRLKQNQSPNKTVSRPEGRARRPRKSLNNEESNEEVSIESSTVESQTEIESAELRIEENGTKTVENSKDELEDQSPNKRDAKEEVPTPESNSSSPEDVQDPTTEFSEIIFTTVSPDSSIQSVLDAEPDSPNDRRRRQVSLREENGREGSEKFSELDTSEGVSSGLLHRSKRQQMGFLHYRKPNPAAFSGKPYTGRPWPEVLRRPNQRTPT